jgi:phosphoesterase RecJ-like protein
MYKECWEKILEHKHIVLATHINPDADTIGSALGLYHILKRYGKKLTLFNATNLPYNLDFLPDINKFKDSFSKEAKLLISLDCGSFDRLGVDGFDGEIINIDHHKSNSFFGDINIVKPEYGATAQVVFELLEKNGVKLNKDSALSLYTALVDDTGFFRFESVDEDVFLTASKLTKAGANPYYVAKMLKMREPLSKVRLIQELLETLQLYLKGRVGAVFLTNNMLEHTGATKDMANDVLDMVRSLATVEVAMLFREEEDRKVKVSLRSKEKVDVSKIAIHFKGGGHKNAAGFTKEGTFDEILTQLLRILKREFDEKEE